MLGHRIVLFLVGVVGKLRGVPSIATSAYGRSNGHLPGCLPEPFLLLLVGLDCVRGIPVQSLSCSSVPTVVGLARNWSQDRARAIILLLSGLSHLVGQYRLVDPAFIRLA